jgi:hypothetical protein
MELTGTAPSLTETYREVQVQVPNAVAALYTVPASTMAIVRSIQIANTTGGALTNLKLYTKGSAAVNQLCSLPVPASGEITFDGTGWNVYDASGARLMALAQTPMSNNTIKGNISGASALPADLTGTQVTSILDTATTVFKGLMSAADKALIENQKLGLVNILDYGADRTGVGSSRTALTNAIAALPNGGTVWFPPGTYNLGNTNFNVSTAHITLMGAARYGTNIVTTSTTEDIITLNQWYNIVQDLTFIGPGSGQVTTKTAGYAINTNPANASYSIVRRCTFNYQFNCVNLGNTLMVLDDAECRYFKNTAVAVTHNSDHQVNQLTCDNNPGALPTGAGIDVQVCASLLLSNCNVIHSNNALNISPATGVTVPSVKGVNCFFDTSVNGLNCTGAGSVLRCEFTNCWFSSMSANGINMQPAVGGQVNGVTFMNCDIYNNVAGTTQGVNTNAQVGKWKMVGCSIAGWTTGVNLVAGTNHFPTILSSTIGSVSAFGVNTTGVVIGAGSYKGLVMIGNDVVDNTTNFTLGALTITTTTASSHRIIDNAGINPRGAVTTPAVPAAAAVVTNLTGFRVVASVKFGATASASVTVNGVVTGAPVANQKDSIMIDPGGTIAFTTTAPASWVWVAN